MTSLYHYYQDRARWIAERDRRPGTLPDTSSWSSLRPEVHRRFMASLGLDPMPEAGELQATDWGGFEGQGYTARKLAYQVMPNCWGSAHLYRPADLSADLKTPAVLYACGHHTSGVIGYSEHAVAWARRGYTCLIFDTIEQHDNPGDHHGLYLGTTPQWIGMGFTPAGAEVLNGLRALELLLQQPGVDAQRVGVTGISGGGGQAFFLAAADDRLRAVATVAGVSSPAHAIRDGHVQNHCACMYPHNRFAHDISLYSALIAPRALLYAYARHDALYSPPEFRSLYADSQARFEHLGCSDRCVLHEYDGPHGYNHRATTDTIHRWFDQHVAGEPHPEIDTLAIADEDGAPSEATLSVFHGETPQPNHLPLLPELITPRPAIRLPEQPEQWGPTRQHTIDRLRAEVFSELDNVREPQALEIMGHFEGDPQLDRYRGRLDGMEQELVLLSPEEDDAGPVVIAVGDRGQAVRPLAAGIRERSGRRGLRVLAIQPRAAGSHAFPEDQRNSLNRVGCLVGLTPTAMMVQDLHHLWPVVRSLPGVAGQRLILHGIGEGAIAMLYHALLRGDSEVVGVILEALPAGFERTPFQVLNAARVADLEHAVGLLAPTPVALVQAEGLSFDWYWAERAHGRTGGRMLRSATLAEAFSGMD